MIPGYFAPIDHYVAGLGSAKHYMVQNPYLKQTFRNRCSISTAGGIRHLVVPVNHPNNGVSMDNLSTCMRSDWRKNHFRGWCSAYGKSPYFNYFRDELETFYLERAEGFCDFLIRSNHLVQRFAVQLGISLPEEDAMLYEKILEGVEVAPAYRYFQPFEERNGFVSGLSILDMMFCSGPETETMLNRQRAMLREHFS